MELQQHHFKNEMMTSLSGKQFFTSSLFLIFSLKEGTFHPFIAAYWLGFILLLLFLNKTH